MRMKISSEIRYSRMLCPCRPRLTQRHGGAEPQRGRGGRALFGFEVVAEEEVLVAEVEFGAGDDGVGPALFVGSVGLVETAVFFVAFRAGFDEGHGAFLIF